MSGRSHTAVEVTKSRTFFADGKIVHFGNSKDAGILYDGTNDEWTVQAKDAGGTLTDRVQVKGNQDITQVQLYNDDPGATGIQLDVFHESASPADNDVLLHVRVYGEDDGGTKTQFGGLKVTALDVTDTTEDGQVELEYMQAGTVISGLKLSGGVAEFLNNAGGTSQQVLKLRGNNKTGLDDDEAYISLELDDDAGNSAEYVRLTWKARDASAATKDGQFKISVVTGNTLTDMFVVDASAAGVVTYTYSAGDVVLADNVSIKLGTGGAESDLSSNGTNTIWNLTSLDLIIQGGTTERVRVTQAGILVVGAGEGGTAAGTGNTVRSPAIVAGGAGNIAGTDLTIANGLGTGTGDVGQVILKTARVATAGDNIQALTTILLLDGPDITASGLVTFDTGVAITATLYQIGRDADSTNQMHLNVPTGATFELSVNDVAQMTLSVSAVNFLDNSITTTGGGSLTGTWSDLGTVTTVDVNGGTIGGVTLDGTISGTPTWASNQAITLSTVAQGAITSVGTLTGLTMSGAINMANNGLSDVGAAGNSLGATTWSINNANAGARNLFAVNNTDTTNTASNAMVQIQTSGGGGDTTLRTNAAGIAFQWGVDQSAGHAVITRGLVFGTTDAIRITNASPPVVTYNATHPTGTFDYVCGNCGSHEAESFVCCGLVEWHDDVLDFREMALRRPGALDYMERVGVIERTKNNEGDLETFTVLGKDFEFAMSATFQNRQRMDNEFSRLTETCDVLAQAQDIADRKWQALERENEVLKTRVAELGEALRER